MQSCSKVQDDEIFLTSVEHDQERAAWSWKSAHDAGTQKAAAAKTDVGFKFSTRSKKWRPSLKTQMGVLLHPLENSKIPHQIARSRTAQNAKVLSQERWDAVKIAKNPERVAEKRMAKRQKSKQRTGAIVEKLKALHRLQAQGLLHENANSIISKNSFTFTGWLLFFYLLLLPRLLRDHRRPPLNLSRHSLQPSRFRAVQIPLALIFWCAAAASNSTFLRNKTATMVLVPVTVFAGLLVVFNM